MENTHVLALTAATAAAWDYIKGFGHRLLALLISRVNLTGGVGNAVFDYLSAVGRTLNWGDRDIHSEISWVRPRDKFMEVAFELPPTQPRLIWLGRVPIMVGSVLSPNEGVKIQLTALRGTIDLAALTQQALDYASSVQTTGHRYRVHRIGGQKDTPTSSPRRRGTSLSLSDTDDIRPTTRLLHWGRDQIGAPRPEDPFQAMALCPQGQAARDDFTKWLSLKDWYQARGIPWRRGHLYHGVPGTGKTSLARALAQQADMPIFVYDLTTLSNEEFASEWQSMMEQAPCMAVFEDIDSVFEGRKNITVGTSAVRDPLSFDCLLNALSGVQTCDGVFTVVTTNHPEKLDPALGCTAASSSRPGRLDRAFEIGLATDESRRHILARICGSAADADVEHTRGMTAAQVTDYAVSQAMRHTWN